MNDNCTVIGTLFTGCLYIQFLAEAITLVIIAATEIYSVE